MPIRIATWNVNSIRKRMDLVLRFLDETAPDVLCLQETKVTDALFPGDALAGRGYPYQAVHGMKGYNGVAICSRLPLTAVETPSWCGLADCRHVQATLVPDDAAPIEVHSLYVPAGGDLPDPERNPKFAHKLDFLRDLAAWSADCRAAGRRIVLAGDLNVAPLETDVWSHKRLKSVVTHTPVERDHLNRAMAAGGWIDAVRHFIPPTDHVYTWWSYRTPDWAGADKGRRLDHVWLSPALGAAALDDLSILRAARGWQPPSDHVPVTVALRPGGC